MPAPEPPFQRFLRSYSINDETGCWVWNASFMTTGYGQIKAFGKQVAAHRFSYELHKGPIPDGMHILHSCDVKACVNPDHLRAGTHAENMAEAAERGLMPSGAAHPQYGKKPKRPKQAHRVCVLGTEFESQNAAERHYGLAHGTVRYWLKNHPQKAQKLERKAS